MASSPTNSPRSKNRKSPKLCLGYQPRAIRNSETEFLPSRFLAQEKNQPIAFEPDSFRVWCWFQKHISRGPTCTVLSKKPVYQDGRCERFRTKYPQLLVKKGLHLTRASVCSFLILVFFLCWFLPRLRWEGICVCVHQTCEWCT